MSAPLRQLADTAWTPTTLRDALGRGDAPDATDPRRRLHPRWLLVADAQTAACPAPPARCACGRTALADRLYDVRGLSTDLRRLERDGTPAEFLCDACVAALRRTRRADTADLAAAQGASAAALTRLRASAAQRLAAQADRRPASADRPAGRVALPSDPALAASAPDQSSSTAAP